jgi:hypothetical protein
MNIKTSLTDILSLVAIAGLTTFLLISTLP